MSSLFLQKKNLLGEGGSMLQEESNPSFHFTYFNSSLFLFCQTNVMKERVGKIPHSGNSGRWIVLRLLFCSLSKEGFNYLLPVRMITAKKLL